MFWRMRSGMGDAVFAPLYKVLSAGRSAKEANTAQGLPERKKVAFHFSHTLTGIDFDLDPGREHRVTALRFAVSAVDSGNDPLDRFGCWPKTAENDTPTTQELLLGADEDFDAVIFALGVDDFVRACGDESSGPAKSEFFRKMPNWNIMRKRVRTTPTKVAQVWFEADVQSLGWARAPGLITALGPPFDTWANMTHTVASERAWRRANGVVLDDGNKAYEGAVAYLCGALSDRDVQRLHAKHSEETDESARRDAVRDDLKKQVLAELYQVLPDLTHDEIVSTLTEVLNGSMKESGRKYGNEGQFLWRESDRQEVTHRIARALTSKLGTASEYEVQAQLDRLVEASVQKIGSSYTTSDGGTSERREPAAEEIARGIAADLITLFENADQRKSALNKLFAMPSERDVFIQANFAGSERYTLSLPGSIQCRISPLDRSVVNMTIAGDWTACGLDAGCVESAVMSGMLAAYAITGTEPCLEDIVGYHHP